MKYELVRFGDFFELSKGFSYSGRNLVDESSTGFITLNSFIPGGGYKPQSEKPIGGEIPLRFYLDDGDVCVAITEQDEGLLASPIIVSVPKGGFSKLVYSHHVAKLFEKKPGLNKEFVYRVFCIPAFRARAAYGNSGSTVQDLPFDALYEQVVPMPPLDVQRQVCRIARAFDEKIEVNREIQNLLELFASELFKSWFIAFDPVRAKMAGEAPVGMDAETAALFSTSIREANEGSIPADWEWGSVGTIADVIDCLHSKKPSLIDQGKPFLQLNTIADDGILRYELAACVSDEDYSKWTSRIEVSGGDCVVTNVGRVGAVSQIPHHFKAAIGRNMTAVRPREKDETASFLFSALTSDFMRREIEANTDSGTILDALNVKNIPLLRIPIPPRALIRKFEEVVSPMIRLRHELHRENVALSSTRDALLPRLISGELEIPEEMLAA